MDLARIASDAVTRATQDTRSMAVAAGVSVVVVTHTTMFLSFGTPPSAAQRTSHAVVNLAAAGAILYGLRVF